MTYTAEQLTQADLETLREAAEAGFHATPPTVLGLLDLIDAAQELIAMQEAAIEDQAMTVETDQITQAAHTVYIVTSGEYSDYRVHAVYLDRRLADLHVDHMNGPKPAEYGPYEVEEWEVGVAAPNNFVGTVMVARDRFTNPRVEPIDDNDGWVLGETWQHHTKEYRPGAGIATAVDYWVCYVRQVSDSAERLTKSLTERAAQILAEWDLNIHRAALNQEETRL